MRVLLPLAILLSSGEAAAGGYGSCCYYYTYDYYYGYYDYYYGYFTDYYDGGYYEPQYYSGYYDTGYGYGGLPGGTPLPGDSPGDTADYGFGRAEGGCAQAAPTVTWGAVLMAAWIAAWSRSRDAADAARG